MLAISRIFENLLSKKIPSIPCPFFHFSNFPRNDTYAVRHALFRSSTKTHSQILYNNLIVIVMDGSPFRLGALPIPIPGKSEEELSINNGIEINTGHIEVPISSPHADFLPSSVDSGICVATGTSEVDKTDGTTNSFEGDENYPIKDFVNHAGLSPKIHVQPFHKILGMTCDVYTADDYEMVTKKFQRCPPDRVYILVSLSLTIYK